MTSPSATPGRGAATSHPDVVPAPLRPVASARRTGLGLALDVVAVLAFAAIGRRSHDESGAVVGVLVTAWPFLTGTFAGWLVGRVWRAPLSWRLASIVWVSTWAVGMVLRLATGRGVAVSFLIVAAIALGVLLLGWRLVARAVISQRRG